MKNNTKLWIGLMLMGILFVSCGEKVDSDKSNGKDSIQTKVEIKNKDSRSVWERFKAYLGIHNYQADLDSLVCLSYREYKNDVLRAKNSLAQAEEIAEKRDIKNRDWEILYIKGQIAAEMSTSIHEGLAKGISFTEEAYKLNVKKEDGVAVPFKEMLSYFCYGMSLHIGFDEAAGADSLENCFTVAIAELMKRDEYSAYCYSSQFYRDNITMAKKYCQKAIDLKPNKGFPYLIMGNIYRFEIGDVGVAEEYYCKALGLDLNESQKGYAYRLIASCYPEESIPYIKNLYWAAKYGDLTAKNILRKMGGVKLYTNDGRLDISEVL